VAAQHWAESLNQPKGWRVEQDRDAHDHLSQCERRVSLWDDLEQAFASPTTQQRVLQLQPESTLVLDNESKERALVGEVISTVALAGQICRERRVGDQGIDMEIGHQSIMVLQVRTRLAATP
jgi:hypothetical protein